MITIEGDIDIRLSLFAAATICLAAPALAVPITVLRYAMPNGNGVASGGSFNYWDRKYNGFGFPTVDGFGLSYGIGDLTDGIVASSFWYNVENIAGTGPYVGWNAQRTYNPIITFTLASNPVVDTIRIHMDNSGVGGVFAPSAILIDGVVTPFTAPTPGTIGWVTFSGLNLGGISHSLQLVQPYWPSWVFISEVTFAGSVVPEPASWAMMIAGFGLIGGVMRRRRMVVD